MTLLSPADGALTFRPMASEDLPEAVSLYIRYYNEQEDGRWTEETAFRRIHQVFSREDSCCAVLEKEGCMLGFAMGYFEQYDDGFAYDLVEIVISHCYQNRGLGTAFLQRLEEYVRQKGALLIQLQAVNDPFHQHFYGRLGYQNASNLVLKTKTL